MRRIFKPSVNLINQLRYPQKLTLLGTIVLIIVLALLQTVAKEARGQIRLAKAELTGLDTAKPLISVLRKLQTYRTTKNKYIIHLATESDLRAARLDVDQEIIKVTEHLNELKSKLDFTDRWQQISDQWELAKTNKEDILSFGRTATGDIIANLQKLLIIVADKSGLTTDPDLYSYYLIDTYVDKLGRFVEHMINMQDLGINSLNNKSISNDDLNYLIMIYAVTTNYDKPLIIENIDSAANENPELNNIYSDIIRIFNTQTDKALFSTNNSIISKKLDISISDYNTLFEDVNGTVNQMYTRTHLAISNLIKERINKLTRDFIVNFSIVISGLIVFIYFFIGIYLSILQSIRRLVLGADEIAKGNLQSKVSLESKDELSQVAESFNTMRKNLENIVSELHLGVTEIAEGNLNHRINLNGKLGFAKELATNINRMTEVFQDMTQDIIVVLEHLSKGNLTIRVTREYTGLFEKLKTYVNNTINDLEKLIKSVVISTNTIRVAAEEISLGNIDLEKRTEQQAASLEETSVSMSKITETVKENSENALKAHNHVQSAAETALEGRKDVNKVIEMMNGIYESTRQITEITNVIDNIAFQTNILALNAAVEAARAGEQGRGFSVVASEIRNLAQRSSVSAQDIKTLINTSVDQIVSGKKMADEAGETMIHVVDAIKNVTETVSDIASSSAEQHTGIQQIYVAINQMDLVTQQNGALVEKAARASQSLKQQTEQMAELVHVFKISKDTIDENAQKSRIELEQVDLNDKFITDNILKKIGLSEPEQETVKEVIVPQVEAQNKNIDASKKQKQHDIEPTEFKNESSSKRTLKEVKDDQNLSDDWTEF